jgi:hypothetical protein
MTAVENRGHPVFSLRQVRGDRSQPKFVEIVVEPDRHLTPELLLVMATSYYNLYTFFDHEGLVHRGEGESDAIQGLL